MAKDAIQWYTRKYFKNLCVKIKQHKKDNFFLSSTDLCGYARHVILAYCDEIAVNI